MPTCRKCNTYFPNRILVGNKIKNISSRKFCLKCSPFGKHNTLQLDKCSSTHRICAKCHDLLPITAFRLYTSKGVTKRFSYCPKCDSERVSDKCRIRKQQAVTYKGGKCEKCGYNKCLRALEFHHTNPKNKDIGIAKFKKNDFSQLKVEIDKCRLLCSNCHREEHEKLDLLE